MRYASSASSNLDCRKKRSPLTQRRLGSAEFGTSGGAATIGRTSRKSPTPRTLAVITLVLRSPEITPSLYVGMMTFACLNCYNTRAALKPETFERYNVLL